MASFAAQAALRSRWSSLIESTSVDVPGEVTDGVRSVVGWLKQARVDVASLEVRQVGRRAVSSIAGRGMADDVVIVHFNDVYNIEQTTNTEPVGGALRFSTAVKALQHLNPLVLFSGDAFSPSMLSTFTKGEQMVPVLNEIGTHCAVFGNHDFDFGLDVLSNLVSQCNFPWLMSNVIDNETGRPLGDGKITHALMCNGHKIGMIGLVEQEWLETLATINPEEVTFIDFLQAGSKLASQLKQEGCEYVIALTHMRTPNDIKLAEGCTDIDLILGGHDHVYEVLEINNKYIVKSGTDFRQFSKININFGAENIKVDISDVKVTSNITEDPVLKGKVEKYSVAAVCILLEVGAIPSRRSGFRCNDPDLSFPHTGDTLSIYLIAAITVIVPYLIIWAVESTLQLDDEYTIKQNKLLTSAKTAGFIYRDYIYAAIVNLTVLEVVKCVVGSPRPTFFDLCKPDTARTCNGSDYVSSYTCTSTRYSRYLQIDSSRSFPSAHTSLSVYCGLFLAWYLQRRAFSWHSRSVLVVPLLQVLCIIYSVTCPLTRITDHRHHWWDVLAGAFMGIATVIYTVLVLCKNFSHPEVVSTSDISSSDGNNHQSVRRLLASGPRGVVP